ncbi:MAG: hypothetical protein JO129_04830 [Candidatus Dependentiae bacterium]|nr:hypothetical protein [Candidatus Dependentiae bacterium]
MKKLVLLFALSFYNIQAMEQENSEPKQHNKREKLFYFIDYEESTDEILMYDMTMDTTKVDLHIKDLLQTKKPAFRFSNYDVYRIRTKSTVGKFHRKQFRSFVRHEIQKKEIQKYPMNIDSKMLLIDIISALQEESDRKLHEATKSRPIESLFS